MISHQIPLTMLKDSDSLFKTIVKASVRTEKRFMIDVNTEMETFKTGNISDV